MESFRTIPADASSSVATLSDEAHSCSSQEMHSPVVVSRALLSRESHRGDDVYWAGASLTSAPRTVSADPSRVQSADQSRDLVSGPLDLAELRSIAAELGSQTVSPEQNIWDSDEALFRDMDHIEVTAGHEMDDHHIEVTAEVFEARESSMKTEDFVMQLRKAGVFPPKSTGAASWLEYDKENVSTRKGSLTTDVVQEELQLVCAKLRRQHAILQKRERVIQLCEEIFRAGFSSPPTDTTVTELRRELIEKCTENKRLSRSIASLQASNSGLARQVAEMKQAQESWEKEKRSLVARSKNLQRLQSYRRKLSPPGPGSLTSAPGSLTAAPDVLTCSAARGLLAGPAVLARSTTETVKLPDSALRSISIAAEWIISCNSPAELSLPLLPHLIQVVSSLSTQQRNSSNLVLPLLQLVHSTLSDSSLYSRLNSATLTSLRKFGEDLFSGRLASGTTRSPHELTSLISHLLVLRCLSRADFLAPALRSLADLLRHHSPRQEFFVTAAHLMEGWGERPEWDHVEKVVTLFNLLVQVKGNGKWFHSLGLQPRLQRLLKLDDCSQFAAQCTQQVLTTLR